MPKVAIGTEGPWFPAPPAELRNLSPALYDYLYALHILVAGREDGSAGSLGKDNIDVTGLELDHGSLLGLGDDDHGQYLTTGRHADIQGNVHGVTAADVGNDAAVWNADRLQGLPVTNFPPPLDGQVLQWFEVFGVWGPGNAPSGGGGGGLQFASTVLEQTLTVGATSVSYVAMAPAGSLLVGVFAEVTADITGAETFHVGVDGARNAWASEVPPSLGMKTSMADFAVLYPWFVKEDLTINVYAVGGVGSFQGGAVELTARYLVVPGI